MVAAHSGAAAGYNRFAGAEQGGGASAGSRRDQLRRRQPKLRQGMGADTGSELGLV